jgi:hypothetical protein
MMYSTIASFSKMIGSTQKSAFGSTDQKNLAKRNLLLYIC